MSAMLYLQFGVPTLFLLVGLLVFAYARFEARRHDRRANRAAETKTGPV